MEEKTNPQNPTSNYSLSVLSVVILVVFLVIVAGLYFYVNKKSQGQVVFPAGINYTGAETSPPASQQQQQAVQLDYAALATTTDLATFNSPLKQYTFQYPKGMIPLVFPNDVNDSSSFNVSDVPAQRNLMTLMETVSSYDPKLVGKTEEYVNSYWKFFSGLKGSQGTESFTTTKGLVGFKTQFVTKGNVITSVNYFFANPNDPNKVLHVNDIFPPEGQGVFLKILNSLDFKK